MKTKLITFIFCILLIPGILAATATISQSGSDSGTVMKGEAFTLTVSGLSGSGTVSINPPSGFEIPDEDKVQSFSEGTTSVSFTTISATEKMTGQTLTAQISVAGSPSTATTSTFSVVLQPSLSLTASPTSKDVTSVNSFDLSINIQNTGETTAQGVSASISLPSGLTTSEGSEKSVGEISASSSSSIGWTITVGTPSASSDIDITIDSSNSDSETVTIPITYSGGGGTTPPGGGGIVATGTTYAVTPEQFSAGTTGVLKAGDRFSFKISNETHYVKVLSFTQTTATIEASSTPQTATLSIGGEKKFELTGDNYYDLYTKLESINYTGNKTTITIKSIHEDITAGPGTTPSDEKKGVVGAITEAIKDTVEKIRGTSYTWIIGILTVGIVLVVVILFLVRGKRKKKLFKHQNSVHMEF